MHRRQGPQSSSHRQWKRPKNRWVRPQASSANDNTNGTAAGKVVDKQEDPDVSKRTNHPILKGSPKNKPQHKTWKRNHAAEEATKTTEESKEVVTKTDKESTKALRGDQTQKKKETSVPPLADASSVMIKRGRQQNQLVLANKTTVQNPQSMDTVDSVETTTVKQTQVSRKTIEDNLHVILKKWGRNKLVLQVLPSSSGAESSEDRRQGVDKKDTIDGAASSKHGMKKRGNNKLVLKDTTESDKPTITNKLEKRGRNQLVNAKPKVKETGNREIDVSNADEGHTSVTPNSAKDDKKKQGGERSSNKAAVKVGNNKLIMVANKGSGESRGTAKSHVGSTGRGRIRKRDAKPSKGPAVKRIKLTNAADTRGSSENDSKETTSQGIDEPSESLRPKKLTEFAYRETSKKKPKARKHGRMKQHRGWSRTETNATSLVSQKVDDLSSSRNMGLVRVVPDHATTPVCPTFARGIPCENLNCTKRHDVPQESATPICSFFQRNGQCLKRDTCPFRHIKVNARTTVCPSFGLLGYCEDTECRMKHVRQPHGDKNKGV